MNDSHEAADIDRVAGAQLLRRNIQDLEAEGFRAMREGLLELLPIDSPARKKIAAIDDSIEAYRARLRSL